MLMPFGKAKPGGGIAFEVKLDEDRRLITDDAAIVTSFDDDDLGRRVVAGTTVVEGHVNFAARQEADMRMHAALGADQGLDVARPMEADRIDRSLHASVAGADNVELDSAELAMLGFGNRCEEWIGSGHVTPQFRVSSFEFRVPRNHLRNSHQRCAVDSNPCVACALAQTSSAAVAAKG